MILSFISKTVLLRQGIILGFLVSDLCLCHAWKKASRSDQFAKVDSTLNGTLDIAGVTFTNWGAGYNGKSEKSFASGWGEVSFGCILVRRSQARLLSQKELTKYSVDFRKGRKST